ncbi:cyclic nucleotide-binding domain-containing protein [Marinimicrobium sp. ABcell2]|uniref:cyclic nucleotide-binding domain-containing protein n=1 Tax=Marinimicrobium sp. ABcell2 TaxID=3069751 RepID=UPI0027B1B92D|nr:cyclic nucleotide-binding domain-containing protein [Marinimicrobium sp. ABcell2]MDQ2077174.1 cyclic nucleotide-binding domain-containing protein [Marinimicrobium sp. ABcell2]
MTITRDQLSFFSPFDTLSEEYLHKVLDKAQVRDVPKGKIIFPRGKSLSESLYLLEGQVDLVSANFEREPREAGSEASRVPLNNTLPTQVSAVATTDVRLLRLGQDFVDLVMAWSESHDQKSQEPVEKKTSGADEHDWMSCLLEAPLFARVPPGNIQQLFVRFVPEEIKAGQLVVREGEPGDYFYVLESGSALVKDKGGVVLAELGPGEYFGEEALVGETTRNASVEMLTDGTLMKLEKADFQALLQEPMMRVVDAQEWQKLAAEPSGAILLDVRLPLERRMGLVPESRNIPLGRLRQALPELKAGPTYVVADDGGRRSCVAAQLLLQAGLDAVILKDAERLHPQNQVAESR